MLQGILIGHLGSDAECQVSNGREFVTFRVAHTNRWTDDAGTSHEETTWVDCIMNGNPTVTKYLKKGQLVYIAGSQSLRVYSSKKDRCMKAGLTINVKQVELLGSKTDDVPSILFSKVDNRAHDVTKHFYCADLAGIKECGYPIWLNGRSGEEYLVDENGWVTKATTQDNAAE